MTELFPGGRALAIGISAYPSVSPLPPAILDDARAISDVLISPSLCGYDPANVTVLLDGAATLDGMRRELARLAACTQPQDTVVIFFSGHGAQIGETSNPESALIPFDCDPDNIAATVLLEAEFSAALAKIPAQRLLIFIDACHAGTAAQLKGSGDGLHLGFSDKALGRLAEGTGRIIVASSRGSETSLILGGAKNSLFTEHLLGALKGGARTNGDGLIRVFDVFNYVAEQLQRAVPGRQHPILKANDVENNFPIALYEGGSKTAAAPAVRAASADPWRVLEGILAELYPIGPQDQDIWLRAGGDLARLRLNGGNGRSLWFSALRAIRQGGGGPEISRISLINAALDDFPHHHGLLTLQQSDAT